SFSRNDEDLKQIIDICNQIYFHFKVLDEIYDRCYLNMENYMRAKEIVYDLNYEIDKCENSLSIVYNYHIKAVIDDIDQLYKIIN
ncbi:MAG: hypothetical protein ACI4PU_04290, partial [Intestinibacter sp.]